MSDYRGVLEELQRKLRREETDLADARQHASVLADRVERTKTTIAGVQELEAAPASVAKRVLEGLGTIVITAAAESARREAAKPYRHMTIIEAAKSYLAANGPATAPEITRALLEGGIRSFSENPRNTVYSILFREAQDKTSGIEKVGRSFKIAEPIALPSETSSETTPIVSSQPA